MANVIYNSFKGKVMEGAINWSDNATTTIRVMLVDDTYTPNIDGEVWKSDIDLTGAEVSGTGYTAGGALLVNRAVNVDTTADWAEADADDVTWATSTITARGAIVYKDTGVAASSPLIAYIDFGTNKVSSAGDFTIAWNVDGVFRAS